jgi:hypothetical protein
MKGSLHTGKGSQKAVSVIRAWSKRGWIKSWRDDRKTARGFFTITEAGLRFRANRAVPTIHAKPNVLAKPAFKPKVP